MLVWGCMVDSLSDGLWVVAQLFWLECIRTAMVDPWEAIARGANVPGTASPSDPQQRVSGAPLRQAPAVLVPARRRRRRWRRKAGQPQRAALSLVHRWFSACHTARDTWHGAVVAPAYANMLGGITTSGDAPLSGESGSFLWTWWSARPWKRR